MAHQQAQGDPLLHTLLFEREPVDVLSDRSIQVEGPCPDQTHHSSSHQQLCDRANVKKGLRSYRYTAILYTGHAKASRVDYLFVLYQGKSKARHALSLHNLLKCVFQIIAIQHED